MFGLPGTLGTLADLGVVVVGFGLIIFVHELGHFLAAKWAGIRVLAFAIGFGPAAFSYRKGMGWRRGSSEAEYVRLLNEDRTHAPTTGLDRVSSTEYRLNWLPLGGYVKMLGQDDMDPGAVSDAPDSYQRTPVWKRMVVISAGVIMNLITAALVFVTVFMVGLRVEPPVVGAVAPGSPAAEAVAIHTTGAREPGLRTGDVVLSINDRPPETFNDIIVATAMSAPREPVRVEVRRPGVDAPLQFEIIPERSRLSGLLDLGVGPSISATIPSIESESARARWDEVMQSLGLTGFRPGVTLTHVNGAPVSSPLALGEASRASGGEPVSLTFSDVDAGETFETSIRPQAQLQSGRRTIGGVERVYEHLLGLTPVMMVAAESLEPPAQGLQRGDIFARIGALEYPNLLDGINEIRAHKGRDLTLEVLRGRGAAPARERVRLTVRVNTEGAVGFLPSDTSRVDSLLALTPEGDEDAPDHTRHEFIDVPGQRLLSIDGLPTPTLVDAREALRARIDPDAFEASVTLRLQRPTAQGGEREVEWTLNRAQIGALHELSWTSGVPLELFEPERVLLQAEGPLDALAKGVRQTKRVMISTYLTFARLAQGTVRVEHLKGPVGIAHLGTMIADRGFIWVVFFLGLISVNLAVINFLPLPIVDGGQFLMLCYEWVRGRPVPVPVQNAVTLAGLVLIGSMFLLVTFNDVKALLGV
ncbi:MAG: site-2 protease family protein [Phycisphaerales bacterium JB059]